MDSRVAASVAIAWIAVAVAGCASHGNEVLRTQDANVVNQTIVDGRTTRADVERIYGPPNATSFADAQSEVWTYRWARSMAKAENFIPYVGAFVGGSDVQMKELVILFNAQNVVVRHTMRETNEAIRRNLSASSSPVGNTPQVSTSPAPPTESAGAAPSASRAVAAVAPAAPSAPRAAARATPAVAAAPTVPAPAPTAASIEPGRWTCGMQTHGSSERRYTMSFVVAADRSIAVASYANAPATVVKASPLTFTAINPRGERLTTFTLRPDNSLIITGPGLNNSASTFFDDGICVWAGNA